MAGFIEQADVDTSGDSALCERGEFRGSDRGEEGRAYGRISIPTSGTVCTKGLLHANPGVGGEVAGDTLGGIVGTDVVVNLSAAVGIDMGTASDGPGKESWRGLKLSGGVVGQCEL